MEHNHVVDVKGLCCSEPIYRMKKAFKEMKSGEVALVISDKPTMVGDMGSFCNFTKHELLKQEENNGVFSFWLKIR